MTAIKHLLVIKSSPEKIYSAITTNEGTAKWWTEQSEIGNKVGDINIFDFGDRYHNEMIILNLIPNKKVEWECLVGDKEWIGTKLIFEIEEKDKNSVLKFTHVNWREETDFFASCNYHWGYYMRSLKQFCETGKGNPFQNE
jgi:uncharacterized protein YndB with AHSA1/START domain